MLFLKLVYNSLVSYAGNVGTLSNLGSSFGSSIYKKN